uniref:ABC transporter domain-containing protein n=1 Tax=Chenopodium quinoa TaxID=63459 RepID=A0A803MIK1_CHEQI
MFFFAKSLDLIDTNASPFFHNFAATKWLIQRIEILSAAVLKTTALCMVLLPSGTISLGFIGMMLSYVLGLDVGMVFSIQNQCIIANRIIFMKRIHRCMDIPSEALEVINDSRPPKNWPSVGKVVVHNLQIRYRPNTPLVLKGINCMIEGGDKIGVVGMTGSGKTTLIGALFLLVELVEGKIIVDGVDICTIGIHDLRSRFGIIPQDPTLFNGSVRFNLDPLCQHTDEEIWEKTIQIEFANCTIITVAHRKPTVMDCTNVPAISDGRLDEYDDSTKLMEKEDTLFGQLVNEYWSHFHATNQSR